MTDNVIFVIHPLITSVAHRHVHSLDHHTIRDCRDCLVPGFCAMSRAVPFKVGVHRIGFTRDTFVATMGKAVLAMKHDGRVDLTEERTAEAALQRDIGAVIEGKIFRSRFIQFVDFRKTDFSVTVLDHIAVGVDSRIDFAFFRGVFPRTVKIAAGHQEKHRKETKTLPQPIKFIYQFKIIHNGLLEIHLKT